MGPTKQGAAWQDSDEIQVPVSPKSVTQFFGPTGCALSFKSWVHFIENVFVGNSALNYSVIPAQKKKEKKAKKKKAPSSNSSIIIGQLTFLFMKSAGQESLLTHLVFTNQNSSKVLVLLVKTNCPPSAQNVNLAKQNKQF